MPRSTTNEEEETRRLMTRAYRGQKHAQDGFDDWGDFTAHVVHAQRREIGRLRDLLIDQRIDPDRWDDPLGQG